MSKAGLRSIRTASTPCRANVAAAVSPPTPPPTTRTRRMSPTADPCTVEAARARCSAGNTLAVNQCARTVVGEQFEQHRVRHTGVEDHHAFDTLLERIEAGLDLGDHAAGNRAVGDQLSHVRRRHLLDQLLRLVEHARY